MILPRSRTVAKDCRQLVQLLDIQVDKLSSRSIEFDMLDQRDEIRQQFWNSLVASGQAKIEDFVKQVDEPERPELFRNLVLLEINYCRQEGLPFDAAGIKTRFPVFSSILDELYPTTDADAAKDFSGSTIHFEPTDSMTETVDLKIAVPAKVQRAGRYLLDQVVGRGSFGEVWKAHDPELDRVVAVKIPRADRHFSPDQLQSFLAEARCVAKLRIPGVVSVYDVGQEGSVYYIVSDFIDGETLASRIKREQLSRRDAALLTADIAETLHRAHLKDLVHRDVKPNNILLDRDGRSFVADFGLAVSEGEQLSESAAVLGTFAYMPPEQARGDSNRVDARADIYSLGVILYQLLTNRLPFRGVTPEDYRQQILNREARPPRTIDDTIPKELERICLKCMSKAAADRYSTALDLASDLRAWASAETSLPQQQSLRPLIGLSIASLLLMAIISSMLWWNWPTSTIPLANAGRSAVIPDKESPAANGNETTSPKNIQSLISEEPPALNGFERIWSQQLGQPPTETFWPGYKTGGFLGFRNEVQGFEISSDPARLVTLGVMDSQHRRIGISIEQPVWGGPVGLFLGYHEVMTDEGSTARFQLFEGSQKIFTDGRTAYRIRRTISIISPKSGYLLPIRELGFVDVEWSKDPNPVRIELEFQGARLVRGRWGQTQLPIESIDSPSTTSSEDFVGPWGIYSQKTTSWFRYPTVQILERPD